MNSNNTDDDELELLVNEKQGLFLDAVRSHHYKMVGMVGGRGSGKSITLSDFLKIASEELPRAKGGWGVKTIKKAKSKLTPGLKAGWLRWQCYEYDFAKKQGDYVLWREPPPSFERPYESPDNWENCISFPNGFVIELESFKLASDENRGSNYDIYVVDEGLNFKRTWLKIVLPTLRANVGKFESFLHHTFAVFSSPPWTPDGQWMYDIEESAKKSPDKYFFMEVRTRDNQAFLPEDYIENLRESLTKMEFEVEVDGKRISKLPKTFYPAFRREVHVIMDDDLEDDIPLMLGGKPFYNSTDYLVASCDFNAHFTSATIWQEDSDWARQVENVFVKSAGEHESMAIALGHAIGERFGRHQKKRIILTGDRNGRNKSAGSNRTMYQQVEGVLYELGWEVVSAPLTFNPGHKDKHNDINKVLAEREGCEWRVRIDEETCKATVISIENSPIEPDYSKDKSSEGTDAPQERATHLSDTVDYYIYRRLKVGLARPTEDFEIDFGM